MKLVNRPTLPLYLAVCLHLVCSKRAAGLLIRILSLYLLFKLRAIGQDVFLEEPQTIAVRLQLLDAFCLTRRLVFTGKLTAPMLIS